MLKKRSSRGSVAIELGIAALIFVAMLAFGLNICISMIGYSLTDRACRDAARSAAQGTSQSEATQRAQRILRTYERSSPYFRNLTVDSITYTDFDGAPQAGETPFVTVVASAQSDLPCPVDFFGSQAFPRVLQFRKSYTFPIVKLNVPL